MVDYRSGTGAPGGDPSGGGRLEIEVSRVAPAESIGEDSPSDKILALGVRLDAVGHGHLDGSQLAGLKNFVAERGSRQGYGYVFDYCDGELLIGMEREELPVDALGHDPVGRLHRDLIDLVRSFPPGFELKLQAVLEVVSSTRKVRHVFRRTKSSQVTKEAILGPADASGSTSELRSGPWWEDLRITIPVIASLAALVWILVRLGVLKL